MLLCRKALSTQEPGFDQRIICVRDSLRSVDTILEESQNETGNICPFCSATSEIYLRKYLSGTSKIQHFENVCKICSARVQSADSAPNEIVGRICPPPPPPRDLPQQVLVPDAPVIRITVASSTLILMTEGERTGSGHGDWGAATAFVESVTGATPISCTFRSPSFYASFLPPATGP
jgi:hypothetical protein